MRRICRLHQCHEMPCRNHGSTPRPTSTSCRRGVVPLRCFVWSSGQSICRVSSSVGECGPGQYYLRLRIPLNRKLSSNLGSCHSSVGETSSDSIPISRFNVVCLFVNFTASLRFSKTIENQQKPPKTTKNHQALSAAKWFSSAKGSPSADVQFWNDASSACFFYGPYHRQWQPGGKPFSLVPFAFLGVGYLVVTWAWLLPAWQISFLSSARWGSNNSSWSSLHQLMVGDLLGWPMSIMKNSRISLAIIKTWAIKIVVET